MWCGDRFPGACHAPGALISVPFWGYLSHFHSNPGDPSLFRKPSKPRETDPVFEKNNGEKRMEKESTRRKLLESHQANAPIYFDPK